MTAAVHAVGEAEAEGAWTFRRPVEGYDRREQLSEAAFHALRELGPKGLRRNRSRGGVPRRSAVQWNALARLVAPLDAARASLHHDDGVRFRRAGGARGGDRLAVLRHHRPVLLGVDGRGLGGSVRGGSAEAFVAAQTLPTETTVRPFLVALAYLLGGFDDFQQLGTFNRLHLAGLVFGAAAVEESLHEAGAVLHRSGYRSVLSGKHHLRGVFSQALLINRSPRLVDEGS